MRIYVACLSAYNNGILHGVWLEEELGDPDLCEEAIKQMLAKSPIQSSEEWQIQDYEGFGNISPQGASWFEISELVDLTLTYGDDLVHAVCKNFFSINEVIACFNKYVGAFNHIYDWVDETFLNRRTTDKELKQYFDYDTYIRDREIDSVDIFEIDNIVHVFLN